MDLSPGLIEIKTKLERWCAYQDRCIDDFNKKIKAFNLSTSDRKKLLDDLILHQFIDETRYVKSIISGKKNIKKWGKNKIVFFLKSKNISESIFQEHLKELDDELYFKNLALLLEKKWKSISTNFSDFEKKNKVFQFLLSKGYQSSEIQNAFNQLSFLNKTSFESEND